MKRTVHFARFAVDLGARRLMRGGAPIHLTPKAFQLLALLVEQAPCVVPKAAVHEHLWPDSYVSEATLLGVVKEIRRALDDTRRGTIIRTAHRVGYALAVPCHVPPAAAAIGLIVGNRRIALTAGESIIGRDEACTIRLGASELSRQHARVVVSADGAIIEDLGSKNGTLVGGRRIAAPTPLQHRDRITLAGLTLVVDAPSSTASTASMPPKVAP